MKIKNLLLTIFLLGLIPFLVVSFVAYRQSIEFQRRQILQKNLETAETLSVAVDSFIQNIFKIEQSLGLSISLGQNPKVLKKAADRTLEFSTQISSLAIYSTDGNALIRSGNLIATPDENFKKIRQGKGFAVSNLKRTSDGRFFFHITIGVKKKGKLTNFIDSIVSDKAIAEFVQIKIGTGGNTGVIDASGRAVTLTFAPDAPWGKRDRNFIPSIRKALRGEPGTVDRFYDPLGNTYRMGASAPIRNIGWAANVFQTEREVLTPVEQRATGQAEQSFLGSIISFALILLLANYLVRPIRELSKGTEAYRKGDFSHRVATGYKIRELNELSDSFNKAAEEVQKRFGAEKHIADELQKGLLPAETPEIQGYEVGTFYASATDLALVGGDFFDIFYFDPITVGIVIGDVQGHGVESSLSTLTAKFFLRDLTLRGMDIGQTLERVNNTMSRQLEPGDFITLFYGLINLKAGKLNYSNAGHPYPLIFNTSNNSFRSLEYHDMALGIEPHVKYGIAEEYIEVGETLVMFTDGVLEARKGVELFEVERLKKLIAENGSLNPADLAREIHRQCAEFAGGKTKDDIAILIIKRIA
jgi:sigma-B regulation protein RsbU (phosphoserine phosphatase)